MKSLDFGRLQPMPHDLFTHGDNGRPVSPPTDDDESSDIPTFEDLVEEVTGRSDSQESEEDESVDQPELESEESQLDSEESTTDLDTEESKDEPEAASLVEAANGLEIDLDGPVDAPEESLLSEADDENEDSAWDWLTRGERSTDESFSAQLERQAFNDEPAGAQSGDGVPQAKLDALEGLADDVSNILLLGPGDTTVENDLCASLVNHGSGRGQRRVLISTDQTPDERLATLRGFGGGTFEETTIISVGDRVRSSRGDGSSFEINGEKVTVETVRDRDDFTRLGLLLNQSIRGGTDGTVPTICFHSITSLINDHNLEKLFRFLHVLQGRTSHAGATAHYHLDPTKITDSDVSIIEQLFDLTVRYDETGNVSFHT